MLAVIVARTSNIKTEEVYTSFFSLELLEHIVVGAHRGSGTGFENETLGRVVAVGFFCNSKLDR